MRHGRDSDILQEADPIALIDKHAFARQLGITVRGLNRRIERGLVPRPFRIGRSRYWRKATLARYLARLERQQELDAPPATVLSIQSGRASSFTPVRHEVGATMPAAAEQKVQMDRAAEPGRRGSSGRVVQDKVCRPAETKSTSVSAKISDAPSAGEGASPRSRAGIPWVSIYKPTARNKPTHRWLAHVVCAKLQINYVKSISIDYEVARQWALEESGRIERWRLGLTAPAERQSPIAPKAPEEYLGQFTKHRRDTGITSKEVDQIHMRARWMIGAMGAKKCSGLTQDAATLAMGKLRDEQGLSLRTCNQYLKALKQFTKWLSRECGITDEVRWLRPYKVTTDVRHTRRTLSDDEIERLLAAAAAGEPHVWHGGVVTGTERELAYRLALTSGLRYGELRFLRPEDFDLREGAPTVGVETRTRTGTRRDTQVLDADVAAMFARFIQGKAMDEPIWKLPDRAYAMMQIDLVACRPPIPYKSAEGFLDFHALRHTCATRWGRHEPKIAVVQKLLRQSDVRQTARYMPATRDEEVATIERIRVAARKKSNHQLRACNEVDSALPDLETRVNMAITLKMQNPGRSSRSIAMQVQISPGQLSRNARYKLIRDAYEADKRDLRRGYHSAKGNLETEADDQ